MLLLLLLIALMTTACKSCSMLPLPVVSALSPISRTITTITPTRRSCHNHHHHHLWQQHQHHHHLYSLHAKKPNGREDNDNNNNNDDDDSNNNNLLRQQLEQQQEQINVLMELIQQQQQPAIERSNNSQQNILSTTASTAAASTSTRSSNNTPSNTQQQQFQTQQPQPPATTTTTTNIVLAPQKVMLFIDGTWLYYSLHERREQECPITQKYGRGWQYRYDFDWEALPSILCQELQDPFVVANQQQTPQQQQQQHHHLQPQHAQRPFEIVRASVFTSFKASTSTSSFRYRMFQDMKAAGYDVHMMETVGKSEKCVDIQLAVEMLHFATVPHAYDTALLLSGDKDFMPAMVRTRQKGRKIGLVSMRRGCNRALYETDGVKDYSVIWLEDHLDKLIKPKPDVAEPDELCYSDTFFLILMVDFLQHAGLSKVSSRDLGRYLKYLRFPKDAPGAGSVLDELKRSFGGGLYLFLQTYDNLLVMQERDDRAYKEDATDNAYWVALRMPGAATEIKSLQAQLENREDWMTPPELAFFEAYSTDVLKTQRQTAYYHSLLLHENDVSEEIGSTYQQQLTQQQQVSLPDDLTRDYSQFKVAELKEKCRERGLPVSGTKATLLERIEKDIRKQEDELQQQQQPIQFPPRRMTVPASQVNAFPVTLSAPVTASSASAHYLSELVKEYLHACGGKASSREVGRYLAANKSSISPATRGQPAVTALQELKEGFGSLGNFIANQSDLFYKNDANSNAMAQFEFEIGLR